MKDSTKKILVLLNKDKPALSETFIQNHIDFFKGCVKNIDEFKPKYIITPWSFLTNKVNSFQLRKSDADFIKFVKKNEVEIILAEYGMIGAQITRLCKKFNVPLVVHFHGHDAHRYSVIESYKHSYTEMFDYASAIVVVSSKMKNNLMLLGAHKEKLFLNGYGVNLSKFKFQKRVKREEVFKVFAVGRFVDKKAPYILILSIQKIIQKIPEIQFNFAGDGYLFETCSRLVKGLKLENNIHLLGAVEHSEIIRMMSDSDVYIQHSVEAFDGDSEGLPNSILEAAASGVPIVSTAHAGISDVLVHRENALLVEENDLDAMAEAIIEVYENFDMAQNLAFNARKTIESNHELNYTLDKLKNILYTQIK